MVRSLTINALNKIHQQLGAEPYNYIVVEWRPGVNSGFADRDGLGFDGKIIELNNLDEVIKLESKGSTSSVSVKLDDTNGLLKNIINAVDIHRKLVNIYQGFVGLSNTEAFLIFTGYISSPIVWDEGERTLSFDIISKFFDMEVGFSPEEGQLPYLLPKYNGKAWPLCFGNPINVPAVLYNETLLGTATSEIIIPDATLKVKLAKLQYRAASYLAAYNYYYALFIEAQKIARVPSEIRNDYIDAIIDWDGARNDQENLSEDVKQAQKLIDQLRELLPQAQTDADRQDTLDRIDSLTEDRDGIVQELLEILQQMQDLDIKKQRLKIETENAEYVYKIQTELQNKIAKVIEEQYKIQRSFNEIEAAINTQTKLETKSIIVTNGVNFPQGTAIKVLVNGIAINGTFAGDVFTISSIGPTYENVAVAARQSSRIDAFWIQDDTITLKGNYCLLTNGKVIKVTDQSGTECILELKLNNDIYLLKDTNNQEQPKLDSDLDGYTKGRLGSAQAHTDKEKEQIIESWVNKTNDGPLLKELKKRIEGLIELLPQAPTDDDYNSAIETVNHYVDYWNSTINSLELPDQIAFDVDRHTTKDEFQTLLKLQNLDKLKNYTDRNPPSPNLPILQNKYYVTGFDVHGIAEVSPIVLPQWINKSYSGLFNRTLLSQLPSTGVVHINGGATVKLFQYYQDKYIANIVPSTVSIVRAWRNIDGFKTLTPVPSQYYVIKDEVFGTEDLGNIECTAIWFKKALSEFEGEGWENQPYVTLSSTIGQNTVDQIEYITAVYSTLQVDAASFAHVKALLAYYPSNWALLSLKNAMQLVEDVAWQARCQVWVKANILYIRYLPEEPTAVDTITETDIYEKTLKVTTTDTENLVTKFVGKWKPDYSIPNQVIDQEYKIVLRHNYSKYGMVEKTYDFYIYNIESLVLKSITFWMIRLSNTFKKISVKTFLTKLNIETGDAVTFNFGQTYIANNAIKGLIEKAEYDSADNSINIEAWLPVRLGEMSQYDFAWPAGISAQLIFPTINEIAGGNAGYKLGSLVPSGSDYSPGDPPSAEDIQLRPKDYGSIKPSDLADTLPTDPFLNMDIGNPNIDAENLYPQNFNLPEEKNISNINKDSKLNYIGTSIIQSSVGAAEGAARALKNKADNPIKTFSAKVDSLVPESELSEKDASILQQLRFNDDSNDSDKVNIGLYFVVLKDGSKLKARCDLINSRDEIPKDTSVFCYYDDVEKEYKINIPVWLADNTTNSNNVIEQSNI